MPKRTSLYQAHVDMGAKMTEFAGWEMPLSYTSIIEEHLAVREAAGLFDIGHMGKIKVEGKGALSLIQKLTTNDASRLEVNQAQYSIICNESGGVIDDILVYRLPEFYMIITNAVNFEKVLSWFLKEKAPNCKIDPLSGWTMISLQGPKSELILGEICDIHLKSLRRNRCEKGKISETNVLISRTGYTGEDGFEILFDSSAAIELWTNLLKVGGAHGLKLCGLGARDTLRLEAALPLYGHEYTEAITPIEAGYSWAVKFEKEDFVGREALLKVKEQGPKRTLTGIALEEKGVPRAGFEVYLEKDLKENIGSVTSGTFSPTLNKGIGLCYIDVDKKAPGTEVWIKIRDKGVKGKIVNLPFYKRKE